MYRNKAKSDNPPHVFAVADSAYHAMLHQRQSQCVVISGESGAGRFFCLFNYNTSSQIP